MYSFFVRLLDHYLLHGYEVRYVSLISNMRCFKFMLMLFDITTAKRIVVPDDSELANVLCIR